jgi:thiol-disulfide isomerase/thioredoxin
MSKKVILFSGSWCKPCQLYKPTFEQVRTSSPLLFETIDVDSGHPSITEYGIRNVPTTVVVEIDGTVRKQSGNMSADALRIFIG